MNLPSYRAEAEVLAERLMYIENALFYLRVKSTCFPRWDNGEVERLESLRAEIQALCEQLYQQGAKGILDPIRRLTMTTIRHGS
jgi:hypothetical protein